LRQVWVNLLSNSVKYCRPTVKLKINITGSVESERAVFQLSDNGIGFDAASAAKLFQPFKRLHENSTVAGVGLGLSLVKRIIEKHGGTISAKGNPGQGAVFTFDLPMSL
jgi:chemotaxis family two-component system sensor kinase Cph1